MASKAEKRRVVIAEDDPDIRFLVADVLESDGRFEVVAEAANGAEAVRLAEEHQPDAVVLDLMMPVMDGGTALPKIREVAPNAAVVVLSVIAERDALGRMGADDADGYVEKGDFTTTADVLASVLDGS